MRLSNIRRNTSKISEGLNLLPIEVELGQPVTQTGISIGNTKGAILTQEGSDIRSGIISLMYQTQTVFSSLLDRYAFLF